MQLVYSSRIELIITSQIKLEELKGRRSEKNLTFSAIFSCLKRLMVKAVYFGDVAQW